MKDLSKLNLLLLMGKGLLARKLVRSELKRSPDDHWLMTKMAQAYVVDGRLSTALQWSDRAMELRPRCPLVNWDRAGILFKLRRDSDAARILRAQIQLGARGAMRAGGTCSHARAKAAAHMADCRLMLSWILADQGRKREALVQVRAHIRAREGGTGSTYTLREGRALLKSLVEGTSRAPSRARTAFGP